MADNDGYRYGDARYTQAGLLDVRDIDPRALMRADDGQALPLSAYYPPSTVPSDSVSSHESSNVLRPQHATTSATSNIETHSPSLPPQRPPERVSRDKFEFINLNSTGGFDQNPARPAKLFVEDSAPQSPDESEAESENDMPRETEGIPADETPSEESQRQSLIDDMKYIKDTLPVILRHRDRGPNLVWQTCRRLTSLKDYVHTLAQALPVSENVESVLDPADMGKYEYYCIECPTEENKKPPWFTVKTFRRHMMQRHYPERKFPCPYAGDLGCGMLPNTRRHVIKNHCKNDHMREATDAEIDSKTMWFAPPPHCTSCNLLVHSWREFYACFTKHCRDRAQELSKGSKPHRPNVGSGKVGKVAENSTRIVSSPIHGAGGNRIAKRRHVKPIVPTAGNPPLLADNCQKVEQDPSREGEEPDNHGSESSQPPRGLGFPPVPPHQEPEIDPGELNNRHCTGCKHRFADCEWCFQSTGNSNMCHMCPNPSMINQAADQGIMPGYPDYHNPPLRRSTFYQPAFNTFDTNVFLGVTPQPEQGPDVQDQFFWGARNNQMPRFRQRRGLQFQAMIDAPVPVPGNFDLDCISISKSKMAEPVETRIRRLPTKVPAGERLTSLLQEFSKLTLSDKLTTSTRGTSFTTINSPPISGCRCPCRTAAILEEPFSGHAVAPLASGKRLEMDLRILAPGSRDNGHPLRTRVQIVAKLLKLRSSASKSSREKKKREEAKLAFEQALQAAFENSPNEQLQTDTDDSEDSDGASTVFDESIPSMQSSFSDISEVLSPTRSCFSDEQDGLFARDDNASLASSYSDSSALPTIRPSSPENLDLDPLFDDSADSSLSSADPPDESISLFETHEVSFDLDLESSLYRMSQLSGGLAGGICADPSSMEPAQVLEFFFKYILYRITAMSRSVDPSRDPREDQ